MVIDVYSGFSKAINSTKQPTGGRSINVTLKEGCSVLNPIFILHGYSLADNYVKWGSRYYYIDDIVILHNEVAEYHCSTDALATYKSDIGGTAQYILRAANQYNPYVIDGKYPAQADTDVSDLLLNGLAVNDTGIYVLGVVGGEATNTVSYYTMGASAFSSLMQALFDDTYLNAADISVELQKELVNPFQYIVSCYWYPFTTQQIAGDMAQIKFGWWDSGVYGGLLSESQRIVTLEDTFSPPRHPQAATRGTYLNDSPYTRYTLNCYSFGSIPLSPSPFVDGEAGAIEIDVDVFTGIAQMYVSCSGGRLFTAISQFGVPIQINQNTANIVGGALSLAGGLVGLAYGNVVGAAQGVVSALSSAMPQVQSQGANGSKVAFMAIPNIVAEFRQIAEEDNITMGRPLCAPRNPSALGGYMECANVDLVTSASKAEKQEIISYMEGGFFYE
jgi:hypothetical protein